jgi:hypothetical protein
MGSIFKKRAKAKDGAFLGHKRGHLSQDKQKIVSQKIFLPKGLRPTLATDWKEKKRKRMFHVD